MHILKPRPMKRTRCFALIASLFLTLGALACGGKADLPALATASAGAPSSASLDVVAKGTKFNTDTLVVPTNQEIVIRFDNLDRALHNVAVYADTDLGEPLFRGELFGGKETREYRFQSPAPGVYYFRCDAHPEMDGAFIVR